MTPSPSIIRARDGVFAVFALNGFAFASWMARVPDVKQMLDLTPGQLGVMLLGVSMGSLIGLPVSGRLANWLGAARTLRLAAMLFLPGFLFAAIMAQSQAAVYLVMMGLFVVGLTSGIWDVCQNLEGSIVERGLGRAIMPWFHAAFSAGTVAGALVGAAMVAMRVPLVIHLGVVGVLSSGLAVWATTRFLAGVEVPIAERDEAAASFAKPARSAWTEPRTLLIGLMVLAAGFTEGTANDWMAVAFVDGHDTSNALGVVALAVFLLFMTAGRLLGTGLLDRYGRVFVLRLMFGGAIVGSLMVIFGNTPIAFAGAAVWGLGASLGFPVGMSAAADDPERAPLRIAVVSTIGYLSFLGGPPLLGFLGDHFGVLNALLAVSALLVMAVFVVPAARPLPDTE